MFGGVKKKMKWPVALSSRIAHFGEERRNSPRKIVNQEAEIFIRDDEMRLPCTIVNISESGAKVACDAFPPPGTPIFLFFQDGSSVGAVTARYELGALGLRFTEALGQ